MTTHLERLPEGRRVTKAIDLRIAPDLEATAPGMTQAQHRARYGFDLGWIELRGRQLSCNACGIRDRIPDDEGIALISCRCSAFIEDHARCVRAGRRTRRVA